MAKQRAKLTRYYFLLQHTHLVVYQTVLFHAIAVLDKLGAHLLEVIEVNQRLWMLRWMASIDHLLRGSLLHLQRGEPAIVELLPQFQSLSIVVLVVAH